MKPFPSHTFFAAALATVLLNGPSVSFSQDTDKEPVLSSEEMAAPDFEIIPSPTELLEAASGATEIDWETIAREIKADENAFASDFPQDEQKALNLGIQVANAFIGLYAADEEIVSKSAAAVEKLASELGADSTLRSMSDEVLNLTAQGRWHEARQKVESLRVGIIRELLSFEDESSIALANVGGWLRGAQLIAAHVSENYSESGGRLLRQASLIETLIDRVETAEISNTTAKELVSGIEEGLKQMQIDATTRLEDPVSEGNALKISSSASRLVSKAQG